jgi:hypothetical protein
MTGTVRFDFESTFPGLRDMPTVQERLLNVAKKWGLAGPGGNGALTIPSRNIPALGEVLYIRPFLTRDLMTTGLLDLNERIEHASAADSRRLNYHREALVANMFRWDDLVVLDGWIYSLALLLNSTEQAGKGWTEEAAAECDKLKAELEALEMSALPGSLDPGVMAELKGVLANPAWHMVNGEKHYDGIGRRMADGG